MLRRNNDDFLEEEIPDVEEDGCMVSTTCGQEVAMKYAHGKELEFGQCERGYTPPICI